MPAIRAFLSRDLIGGEDECDEDEAECDEDEAEYDQDESEDDEDESDDDDDEIGTGFASSSLTSASKC